MFDRGREIFLFSIFCLFSILLFFSPYSFSFLHIRLFFCSTYSSSFVFKGRYLKGLEKVTWVMRSWRDDDEVNVDVHADSDWAKGPERKSTSGGRMMINGTVVKHWSRMQATRALSTAETEYYAVVTVAPEGLGMQSMTADLGLSAQAAKAIAFRRGLELKYLVAGGNQVRESEDEANSRRAKLGRPPDEREAMARDRSTDPRSRRTHENQSEQQGK